MLNTSLQDGTTHSLTNFLGKGCLLPSTSSSINPQWLAGDVAEAEMGVTQTGKCPTCGGTFFLERIPRGSIRCPLCGTLGATIEKATNVTLPAESPWLPAALALGTIVVAVGFLLCVGVARSLNDGEAATPAAQASPAPLAQPLASSPVAPYAAPTYTPPPRALTEYERDVMTIKRAVLADTVVPSSARFCDKFEVIPRNKRGNKVYIGWYESEDLLGTIGRDSIIAELDSYGNMLQINIGDLPLYIP